MIRQLILTEELRAKMQTHLFPGDGLEAGLILICGRAGSYRSRLCGRELICIPHAACAERTEVSLTWPGELLETAIDAATENGDSIVVVHSHPTGHFSFSDIDNRSDRQLMCTLHIAVDAPHGSGVMVPNGAMKCRVYDKAGAEPVDVEVVLCGHNIQNLGRLSEPPVMPFADEMRAVLATKTACVVGVSGTGSPVAEMLARLGVGRLILIDFDLVEEKNLNRILNSCIADVTQKRKKSEMMRAAINGYRRDVDVVSIAKSVASHSSIVAASGADVIFSCVDTVTARMYCDLIAQIGLVPLIDVGVVIPTRKSNGQPEITDVYGRIDFVRPGAASLEDRGVVTPDALQREYLLEHAPHEADRQQQEGYIRGHVAEAPSVITVNMLASSKAVNEWIARMFPYRHEPNEKYCRTVFMLGSMEEEYFPEDCFVDSAKALLGLGLVEPLLGLPTNSVRSEESK